MRETNLVVTDETKTSRRDGKVVSEELTGPTTRNGIRPLGFPSSNAVFD